MGLSIRAYARHRGVSHVAVKKAIDTGRISQLPDGTIDPVVASAKTYRSWSTLGYNQAQLAKLSDLLVRTGTLLQNWARAQQGIRSELVFDNVFRQSDCCLRS